MNDLRMCLHTAELFNALPGRFMQAAILISLLSCCNALPDSSDWPAAELAQPAENRFTVEVLGQKLYEPMELAVSSEEKVIFIERQGGVHMYDPNKGMIRQVGKLDVYIGSEDGLLGLALDPNFEENHWLYLFYSPVGSQAVNRVSRFRMHGDTLEMASEKVVIDIPVIRACCHSGGSLE